MSWNENDLDPIALRRDRRRAGTATIVLLGAAVFLLFVNLLSPMAAVVAVALTIAWAVAAVAVGTYALLMRRRYGSDWKR